MAMIPEGRVGSYAQVAELAGFAGAARAVGNALHINTNTVQVPCHRVVCAKGNASDDFLVILRPADIAAMLQTMPKCRTIVSTGGKSSEELVGILDRLGISGVVQPPVGMFTDVRVNNEDIRWWRMPSSSRAYPMKLEAKAALYRKVF